jgi:hypothetical protein
MKNALPEFLELHGRRPIFDNHGGMCAPHLFAAWFMVRTLAPKHIVESGVFKGLGTWILESAAPDAEIVCIDPDLEKLVYRSPRARYRTEDFATTSWDLPRDSTLLFFDDHQNAPERVLEAQRAGFRHLIFEDNYPAGRGDCYSLKQVSSGAPPPAPRGVLPRAVQGIKSLVAGDRDDRLQRLDRALVTYFEFPPVLRVPTTRWGDPWDERYPTPAPLFSAPQDVPGDTDTLFLREATSYTWICYAEIRPGDGG